MGRLASIGGGADEVMLGIIVKRMGPSWGEMSFEGGPGVSPT